MISVLLKSLELLIFLLTGPLTMELALVTFAVLFLKRPRRPIDALGVPFQLAVIVPAQNEAAHIGSAIHSLLIARSQMQTTDVRVLDVRILVVAYNCTDATAEHAKQAGAEVRILDVDGGKSAALHFAFQTISADGYFVMDARSIADPDVLDVVQARLATGADALQCRREAVPTLTRYSRLEAVAFRSVYVFRAWGRQGLGLSCGVFDDGFALRRSLLDRIPYTSQSAAEYHLMLVANRIRVRYVDHGTIRKDLSLPSTDIAHWRSGRLLFGWALAPQMLLRVLTGSFRFFEPMLDILGLPATEQTVLLLTGLLLPYSQFRIYAAASLALLALHSLAAALCSEEPLRDLCLLLYSPIYLVKKLRSLPTRLGIQAD